MSTNIQVDEKKFNWHKQETAYPMACPLGLTHRQQASAGMML
jgi:hypothetical protein